MQHTDNSFYQCKYLYALEATNRKIMKRLILTVSMALAFVLFAFPEASTAEKVTLQLRWHHGFQFAGYYMAKEKGLFEKENLNVSFVEGGVGINHFDQVTQGEADFGVAGSELAIEYLKGRPFKCIAVIFQHSPYALMVRQSSGYNNPQQLRGKKIYMALAPRSNRPNNRIFTG
ncbi:ABC-type nitrate/sulfonate/bicarbonate transport systems periplasmic components-like protein [Desulfatibacillum aliphaticivorans]|uniref:Thiamine pyrimidine synthase n=1 Tax=Desulfatibacillum aliphaticivorans TaxID=218208 RepID=B8FGX3_DESAL|nr:ABC transporter substrate-binding protein [Desulfatibacillum aliphaticivorans]ACL05353.1 ABC-type nitrate/sulfonate/bicarbonate transport systems periplasmic components-like protein [Desulfatibacillum aliphaticivorans]